MNLVLKSQSIHPEKSKILLVVSKRSATSSGTVSACRLTLWLHREPTRRGEVFSSGTTSGGSHASASPPVGGASVERLAPRALPCGWSDVGGSGARSWPDR